jgi:hypothetical protein
MLPDRLVEKAAECDRKAALARDPSAAEEFRSLRVVAATADFNHKVEGIRGNWI